MCIHSLPWRQLHSQDVKPPTPTPTTPGWAEGGLLLPLLTAEALPLPGLCNLQLHLPGCPCQYRLQLAMEHRHVARPFRLSSPSLHAALHHAAAPALLPACTTC